MKPNLGIDPRFEHAYAIIRYNNKINNELDKNNIIKIKKIVWNLDFAELEISRLEREKKNIASEYFYQIVRVEKK